LNVVVHRRWAFALLAVLGALVAVSVPLLGADPWPFRTPPADTGGVLGPLVRAADGRWDLGVVRSPAVVAGVLIVVVALVGWRRVRWSAGWLTVLTVAVVVLVVAPAVLLQVALRDATAPWFHTNDSTYQIELAGELVLDGKTPYGHDYAGSGLERFYSRNGSLPPPNERRQVALTHFAYFPGAALTAAAWRLLPSPWDDYRLFVFLATVGCVLAFLLFPAPPAVRLALGAAVALSPVLVRGAWFGQADAPSLLCLVLAFALVARSRFVWAAGFLAAAVLLKQFALVAVPFLAVMLLQRRAARGALAWSAAVFGAVLVAGFLPFLLADAHAVWEDTIRYGAGTYRILGYGLSAILLNLDLIDDRYGSYPFAWLVALVWVPVTVYLLWQQRRSEELWEGAAGFAVSIFTLLFIARVFQTSYLAWPLVGIAVAFALAASSWRRLG
jgi:Glycosyltransferase family 87